MGQLGLLDRRYGPLLYVCLLLQSVVCFLSNQAFSTSLPVECLVDDDYSSPELEKCLQIGESFLDNYLNSLRHSKHKQEFNKCSEFLKFQECFKPFIDRCPAIHKSHRSWMVIHDLLYCSCNKTSAECQTKLGCFEKEYGSVMVKRCDAYYKFNLEQRTRERCHFAEDNVQCKERLISSACGIDMSDFAHHVARAAVDSRLARRACTKSTATFDPFSYSKSCPVNFVETLQQCQRNHLDNDLLEFRDENDLVAEGRKHDVKRACRAFRQYKRCSRPTKRRCKKGYTLLMDYDNKLRTYIAKMEYICDRVHKKDYSRNMECYRNLLRNRSLSRCDSTWDRLQPLLERVTAHEFYCRQRSAESRHLDGVLNDLRLCYEDVFTDKCGRIGGAVIGGLMQEVFRDPYYLRYDYKPDCKLHRDPPSDKIKSTILPSRHTRHNLEGHSTMAADSPIRRPQRSNSRTNLASYLTTFSLASLILVNSLLPTR